jgi:rubrerythrin
MTDQKVETHSHEYISHESFKKSLKYCIDKELELIKLYARLQSLIPIPEVKGIFYEMITDEQNHASRMISIYARQANDNDTEDLSRMPVKYTTKPIKSKNEFIEFDLRIPVITGIPNQSVQRSINSEMEKDIMEFKDEMDTAAREGSAEAKSKGRKFIPYIASTNYAVTYDRNNILSISIIYHEHVGGKTVYIRSSYNFDTRTGKPLGLRDIFKPGVQYRELINAEVKKQIQSNPNIYPPGAAANFKGIAEDQPYYLEGDNMVIYFGFNQIAPTISEIPVIRIPLSRFKNQLRTEYFG